MIECMAFRQHKGEVEDETYDRGIHGWAAIACLLVYIVYRR